MIGAKFEHRKLKLNLLPYDLSEHSAFLTSKVLLEIAV